MSTISIVAKLHESSFLQTGDGGENFRIAFETPVIGRGNRELLSGLNDKNELLNIQIRRRADYEDELVIGTVVNFDTTTDELTFLVPVSKAGKSGFPIGTFVVTADGIVAAIVGAKAQAGDLARRLIDVDGMMTERVLMEQPAVEYKCLMVGGMTTTAQGMAYYYRPPTFPPALYGNVHATPQKPFFWIDERNSQETHLIARLTDLIKDGRRLNIYLAASILRNAASMAGTNPEDYRDAVLKNILDYDRVAAIQDAFDSMAYMTKDVPS